MVCPGARSKLVLLKSLSVSVCVFVPVTFVLVLKHQSPLSHAAVRGCPGTMDKSGGGVERDVLEPPAAAPNKQTTNKNNIGKCKLLSIGGEADPSPPRPVPKHIK